MCVIHGRVANRGSRRLLRMPTLRRRDVVPVSRCPGGPCEFKGWGPLRRWRRLHRLRTPQNLPCSQSPVSADHCKRARIARRRGCVVINHFLIERVQHGRGSLSKRWSRSERASCCLPGHHSRIPSKFHLSPRRMRRIRVWFEEPDKLEKECDLRRIFEAQFVRYSRIERACSLGTVRMRGLGSLTVSARGQSASICRFFCT